MDNNGAPNIPVNTAPVPDAPPVPPGQEYHNAPPEPPHFAKKSVQRKKRIIFIVVVSTLVMLAAAGAAYWFLVVNKKSAPKAAAPAGTQPAERSEVPDLATDATITTYKSSKLNIEIAHRKDWRVRENADKSELIITSPKVTYVKADGSPAEDAFTLKVRTGTIPEAMQSTVIGSIAVRDSETIAYDQPTDQQRQYTNLTDAGKDADTFNFVIISSSTSYKAGQPLGYGVNLTGDAFLFVGGYGKDEGGTLAFDSLPKADFASETYEQAIAVIKSLKVF